MDDQSQMTFDEVADDAVFAPAATSTTTTKPPSEAKRSIGYVMEAVLRFGKVPSFADLLRRIVALRLSTGYSPYNALLILLQRPAATFVLPAHHWETKYGYVIGPGEQPLVLLQPGGPVMFLLDRSQVEAGPDALDLPVHLSNPYAMADADGVEHALGWVVENAKVDGVRVSRAGLGIGFAGCVRESAVGVTQRVVVRRRPEVASDVPVRFDVELNRSYSATEQLATLAHELGHVYCGHLGPDPDGHWKDRRALTLEAREIEAESVALIVVASLAPGLRMPDHIGQYVEGEPVLEGTNLEAVLKAAGRVLDIADGWGPRWTGEASGPT